MKIMVFLEGMLKDAYNLRDTQWYKRNEVCPFYVRETTWPAATIEPADLMLASCEIKTLR
jgi:hypothetical protein